MLLVTGATGTVGREVVASLSQEGRKVRALVRDPEAAMLPTGVESARGDLTDPGSLSSHLDGVEAAFLVWPFTDPDLTRRLAPDVVGAITQEVPRVVLLSAQAAAERPGSFWALAEQPVEAMAHEWTVLRPGGFAKNTLMWAPQIRSGDVVRWVYGAARRSLIHEADIAAVAVRALLDDGHHGRRYALTGPTALTQEEQVATIGRVLGRTIRWKELDEHAAREQLVAMLGDGRFADMALRDWSAFVDRPEPVTGTVEEVTGRPARSFEEWVRDHAADFGGSGLADPSDAGTDR